MEWITTDNASAEVWRRLLEFANPEFAVERIAALHGTARNSSEERNYRKQAEQIRVCLLQGQEYFDAARTSSPYTSPNHLYYGMVSLASAVMLVNGDGKHSLDYLRTDQDSKSHGLDFTLGVPAKSAGKGLTLLENSYVKVMPAGHFRNWYSTLPEHDKQYCFRVRRNGYAENRSLDVFGYSRWDRFEWLAGRKRTLLGALTGMPDLLQNLRRLGVPVAASRCLLQVEYRDEAVERVKYTLHSTRSESEADAILESFRIPAQHHERAEVVRHGPAALAALDCSAGLFAFYWPNSRTTLTGDEIAYAENFWLREIGDAYIAAFALSMLARYYPDVWVTCLDSHASAAKVAEAFVAVYLTKFPVLALSRMLRDIVIVSTQRPFWW
jgi:hypothetical protein